MMSDTNKWGEGAIPKKTSSSLDLPSKNPFQASSTQDTSEQHLIPFPQVRREKELIGTIIVKQSTTRKP